MRDHDSYDSSREASGFEQLTPEDPLSLIREENRLTLELLSILRSPTDLHRLIADVVEFFRGLTGCEAVGIRFREGDDYPYFESRGFSPEFIQAENRLCTLDQNNEPIRDSKGNPVLECMCGNVIYGRCDPRLTFFTAGGSFWSNCTTDLLASTTDEDRQARTRNRCNGEGYESVALIPLRAGDGPLGLLQLNDKRKGRFTPELIGLLERLSAALAIGLAHRKATAALRESETKYRTIADFTYDWEYWRAPDGRLLYTSPSCKRLTGYTAEEFQADAGLLNAIVHSDDRGRLERHICESLQQPCLFEVDFRIITRSGEVRWIGHRCQPVHDEHGRFLGVRASNRDITDRKRAEEELRNSIQLSESVRKAQSSYMRGIDAGQVFSGLLESLVSLTGSEYGFIDEVRRDEHGNSYKISLALSNIAWDENSKRLYERLAARNLEFRKLNNLSGTPVLTGRPVIANAPLNDPRSGGLPEGHPPLHSFMGIPMYFGGELIGVAGVANRPDGYDEKMAAFLEPFVATCAGIIHAVRVEEEKRRSEAAFRDSEKRFELAMDAADQGLWDWDLRTNRIYSNPRFYTMLGYEVGEIGCSFESWAELLHPDDRERTLAALGSYLQGASQNYEVEFRMKAKGGDWRWILSRGRAVERDPDGRPLRMIGTHMDVSNRKQAEQALRQSEERYRTVVEDQTETICRFRPDGTFTFVNDVCCRFFGKSRDELIGKQWVPNAHPEDREMISSRLATMSPSNPVVIVENRVFSAQGEIRWMQFVNRGFFDQRGNLCEIQAVGRDVTDRKKTEEDLRKSREQLNLAIEGSGVGLWDWMVQTGATTFNERWAEIVGYTLSELAPLSIETWNKLAHPDDLRKSGELLQRHFAGELPYYECEARMKHKDGRWVWILDRGKVIHRDAENRPIRMAGTHLDITERVEAERHRWRLETAVEQAGDAVVITDLQGDIQYVNPAFERITGYTQAEAIGRNPRFLKSGEQDEVFYRELWDTILAGKVWEGRFINRRKEGTLYHEKATISPLRESNGEIRGFVAVKKDVTREDELQEQLIRVQKMNALGQMSAGIAHDFSNLLAIIRAQTELALRDEVSEDERGELLAGVTRAVDQASGITRGLLTFGSAAPSQRRRIDLCDVVREAEKLISHALPSHICLETDYPSASPCPVMVDPAQLQQVLLNLALNARDAMPGGGVLRIAVSQCGPRAAEGAADSGNHGEATFVRLCVTDTGTGMPPEILARIFEPFFTTKERGAGTGLGLSIVHGIIEDHGGKIDVRSTVGAGTSFAVYLPLADRDRDRDAGVVSSSHVQGSGEVILLAVKDPYLRGLIVSSLRAQGYRVIPTGDGNTVLTHLDASRRDVKMAVLDAGLSGRGGLETVREMRGAGHDIPVIILAGREELNVGQADKYVEVIAEPFSINGLICAVGAALGAGKQEETQP